MVYRFVRIDIGGAHGRSVIVNHLCDEDAFSQAYIFGAGRAVEIWCGDRQLTTLLPDYGLRSQPFK